ncbi:TIGR02453 family protein [Mesorhizobium opportunistum]|uniref:TIGR02453 family protein n=1 Tax=Mesorhizobium opportunistum TaxID=593909 RepID=A0ABV1YPC3_9HYPH|nr:TIGR02453 family protein [Mesorhizobium sp.]TIN92925.1 MAG: TIGR02453 family protein [Mesorhizobium sp.]TJU95299.1 MAG: TIGR02453 family protein [Mesorhizobium sp.]TJV17452.1 MAG: TIGR02453 family protein [Mesorhizobium sp.]
MESTFKGFGQKAIPFLKALDFHQSREWFLENRDLFETELRDPLGDLVDTLTLRFAEAGLGLRGDRKKSLFRINRDVRFARDKRPYNRHLSAILSPDGTKMEQGVFYVHIGLEGCFAGVAWWQPEAALLLAIRRSIETWPERFRAMVKALNKNGLELDTEGAMKRTPRGFEHVIDKDLAAAIRNRHFVVRHVIDPAGIHGPELVEELVDFTLRAKPLLDWGRAIEGKTAKN